MTDDEDCTTEAEEEAGAADDEATAEEATAEEAALEDEPEPPGPETDLVISPSSI